MSKKHLHSDLFLRFTAALGVIAVFLFLSDNLLIYWFKQPGIRVFLGHLGLLAPTSSVLTGDQVLSGWIQLSGFVLIFIGIGVLCVLSSNRSLNDDAQIYTCVAAYIVRAAFWAVLLIGIVDGLISFLRVEGFLPMLVGDHLATQLGRSIFRGKYVHYPLLVIGALIALYHRGLGFTWLALLIVAAEFSIVITRFIFSYEQAFMGDLVRFWYAGLFLFASAYALMHDGHVRVDVFYTNFTPRGRALSNIFGSLLLGLPLCWNILYQGMHGKGSAINSPLLSFEISQSGFGMYTKYLMAGYLVVFAASMAIQFTALFLESISSFRSPPATASNISKA